MKSETQEDRQRIRSLLHIAIASPEAVRPMSGTDIDLLIRVCRRARLLGRISHAIQSLDLLDAFPDIAKDQMLASIAVAESRKRIAMWELDRIEWALGASAPKPMVALKGCAYAIRSLPNANGRIFADVDLLVPESSIEEVEELLNQQGWKTTVLRPYDDNYYRNWTHELPPLIHEQREVEVDLHHNILPRTARITPPAAKLLESSQESTAGAYHTLCDEDMVLHAIVHLFVDSDLSDKIRDLVDISGLLTHFSGEKGEGFWSQLVKRATELKLGRPVFYALRYSQSLMHTEIPEDAMNAVNKWKPSYPVLALMDRLVSRSLYPIHPDRHSKSTEFSRVLLLARSHWLRMPPWLLAYHVTVKFVRGRFE